MVQRDIVVGIDPATHLTGWSIIDITDDEEIKSYGEFVAKAETQEQRIHIMGNSLTQLLNSLILEYGAESIKVDIEDIQLQNSTNGHQKMANGIPTFKLLAKLQGVLIDKCESLNVKWDTTPAPTWRSGLGIKGKTRDVQKKNAMILVENNFGIKVDDNISEAICIGINAARNKYNIIDFT